MDGRKRVFLGEEAAVDGLAKGSFWDKVKYSNDLFEINKGEKNTLKPPQNAVKNGEKEKFSFW